jgi:hypothetical protein
MVDLTIIIVLEILIIIVMLLILDLVRNGKGAFTPKFFWAIGFALIFVSVLQIYSYFDFSGEFVVVSSVALGILFLILAVLSN